MTFQSKVVVITGASAGIGAGTAIKFAREGASGIALHGRNVAALQEVKRLCDEAGQGKVKTHICVGDITQEETRKKLIDETIKEFGRLDILFNNAGIAVGTPANNVPMDLFDQIFDVNLRSVVALTNLAIPHLVKTGGNVINNSSVLGSIANPAFAVYSMTKAALDHYTRLLAVDLGPQGVRINCIKYLDTANLYKASYEAANVFLQDHILLKTETVQAQVTRDKTWLKNADVNYDIIFHRPGLIEGTEILSRLGIFKSEDEQKDWYIDFTKCVPFGARTGTVDEVADLVIFLASDKAKFITGACVPVDGGHTKVASAIA